MKSLGSPVTTENDAAGQRTLRRSAAPLAILLAAIGCWTAMPASADDDKRPAEVTITVIEDPEQLKEKINKIHLPEVHEDARPVQKTAKQPTPEKTASSTGGQQHNETTERHHDGAERQRATGSEQRDQSTESRHDANAKPTNPGKAEDESHHGDSKRPR